MHGNAIFGAAPAGVHTHTMAIQFARARYISRSSGGSAVRTGELFFFGHRDAPTRHRADRVSAVSPGIAEMTGTTLHTVSRILSEWERLGVLQGGHMRVVIRDQAALARIADDMPAGAAGNDQ